MENKFIFFLKQFENIPMTLLSFLNLPLQLIVLFLTDGKLPKLVPVDLGFFKGPIADTNLKNILLISFVLFLISVGYSLMIYARGILVAYLRPLKEKHEAYLEVKDRLGSVSQQYIDDCHAEYLRVSGACTKDLVWSIVPNLMFLVYFSINVALFVRFM